jgi:hypothetical protein
MMNDRMRGGRWKIFRGQNDGWLENSITATRIVGEGDDAISARRYALMCLRYARTSIPPKPRSTGRGGGSWMAA